MWWIEEGQKEGPGGVPHLNSLKKKYNSNRVT